MAEVPEGPYHFCGQEDRVKRIELILAGNGHPEDGYVYKVIAMAKSIEDINQHLTGISGIVKELHEESVSRVAIEKKGLISWNKVMQVVGLVMAFGMLYIGYKNLENRMDKIGVPLITNSRGELMALPDSTKILFFPNDSVKYTIVKDK